MIVLGKIDADKIADSLGHNDCVSIYLPTYLEPRNALTRLLTSRYLRDVIYVPTFSSLVGTVGTLL